MGGDVTYVSEIAWLTSGGLTTELPLLEGQAVRAPVAALMPEEGSYGRHIVPSSGTSYPWCAAEASVGLDGMGSPHSGQTGDGMFLRS